MAEKRGEITKLYIEAFDRPDFDLDRTKKPPVEGEDVFVVMFNPEKYSRKYQVEYEKKKGKSKSARPQKFKGIKSQDFEIEFVLDGTGVASMSDNSGVNNFPRKSKDGVEGEVKKLINMAGKVNGDTHRTSFLKVAWGDLVIRCVLDSLDINYTLFDSDGKALRATVRAKFIEVKSDGARVNEDRNNSPDLTHLRTVESGDRLHYMTHDIYRDPKYYLQIARHNGLNNFRRLKLDQQLSFPPLTQDKS